MSKTAAQWASAPANRTGWGVAEIAIFKAYTKYADELCFKKHGLAYKDLELEMHRGKADKT